jgi:hypothetical protein
MRAAAIRIQKVGKTKVKASPIATATVVLTRKASMAPTKTESALNFARQSYDGYLRFVA